MYNICFITVRETGIKPKKALLKNIVNIKIRPKNALACISQLAKQDVKLYVEKDGRDFLATVQVSVFLFFNDLNNGICAYNIMSWVSILGILF